MNRDIDKKTMHRGDCGHFHEAGEMETITLKIRKGKDCSLEATIGNLFPSANKSTQTAQDVISASAAPSTTIQTASGPIAVTTTQQSVPEKEPEKPNRYAIPGYDPSDPKVVKLLNPEEKAKFLKESAIPPEFARYVNPLLKSGIGIPPGAAEFETKGATERRVV